MLNYSDESQKIAQKTHDAIAEKEARKMKTPKVLAVIDQSGCTGCEACIQFCPVDCIEVAPGPEFPGHSNVVEVDLSRCIGCKLCAKYCPWDTIHMVPNTEAFDSANDWTLRSVVKLGAQEGEKLWSAV